MSTPNTRQRPRIWRRYAFHAVIFVLFAVSYRLIWDRELVLSPGDRRRQLAYLDTKRTPTQPYGRIKIDQNYQSLLHPSTIDSSLFRKKKHQEGDGGEPGKGFADDDSACDNALLFLPHSFAHNGHASQLNNYLLAAMIATFTNRAMIILEAPPSLNEFESNSQFGCPPEAWETIMVRTGGTPKRIGWNADFPNGLSRLIKHPPWLSRQCPIPCQESHTYEDWEKSSHAPLEIKCTTNGRQSNVIAMGGRQIRDYFQYHYKDYMVDRTPPASLEAAASSSSALKMNYEWALRLGAAPHEARLFSGLQSNHEIWDFVSAFMARSGILRFQPWIARDVEEYVAVKSGLPLDMPYDAVHVRRGNSSTTESEGERFVAKYWNEAEKETTRAQRLMSTFKPAQAQKMLPKDYIPFTQYLRQFDDIDCPTEGKPRIVYVATDDPTEVQSEINDLPKDAEGNTLLTKDTCHKFKFVFSPFDPSLGFHIELDSDKGGCDERYSRNVASIADLMILAKSDVFVGEFNSNWGRLVRIFRLRMMSNDDSLIIGARPVLLKEMKIAWGHTYPGPPGW